MQCPMVSQHEILYKMNFYSDKWKNLKQIPLCMQYHTSSHTVFSFQGLVTEFQIPVNYDEV
jgi:hypothetical protein